ncbi:CbiX/SirB N-terminal domain-containing protein [Neiella marina]|uniref:CbiX/SirB N-terminal domain-containing protein n=1 Tax=Neiella holothuriorum TaxID=2870530 RepID=A0ABS7EIB5_9GAMM|nr:CbiX/SirB N-terminal domain-containing protein [Neiella holothuriorum]MBW8192087.1 CbiX/SirB N-terminal domain-containing protein [Neiella holothuriorum]
MTNSPQAEHPTTMILAAHGSRLQSSNDEVAQLATKLAAQFEAQFDSVRAAFLELAEPSIEDSIAKAIADGCHQITVVPYFLAAGRHVREDVPAIVAEAQRLNPQITIQLTEHLGISPGLVDAIHGLLPSTNNGNNG